MVLISEAEKSLFILKVVILKAFLKAEGFTPDEIARMAEVAVEGILRAVRDG